MGSCRSVVDAVTAVGMSATAKMAAAATTAASTVTYLCRKMKIFIKAPPVLPLLYEPGQKKMSGIFIPDIEAF
jgi:hypothetical protein